MKGTKPQVTPRNVTAPSMAPGVVPRKMFTRNLTVNVGQRKYLVVGGLSGESIVGPVRIAKVFGLALNECLLCDPREIGKIEAGREAGLKEFNVTDFNRKVSQ